MVGEGMDKELHGEEDYIDYTDFCCCFHGGFWVFKDSVFSA